MSSTGRLLAIQSGFAAGGTSSPTTTSASYATIAEMTKTLTTRGGNLKATGSGQFSHSVLGGAVQLAFSLDGAAEVAPVAASEPVATGALIITHHHLFTSVSPGSHTVTWRWKTDQATLTASGTARELTLEEVPV